MALDPRHETDAGIGDIVSFDDEQLILVDDLDHETGHLDKGACHDGDGVLHRAFSLFIFNDEGELLLQQRAADKRLWPLYWSNSCCSHPRQGESMTHATRRRLEQELGLTAELEFLYKFQYHARFGEIGSERELCWVFAGRAGRKPHINANEIAAARYIAAAALDDELQASPETFTPWFKMEWTRLRSEFAAPLARYLEPDRSSSEQSAARAGSR